MPFIDVESDVKLYYEERGRGRPILFVHGFMMSHDVWAYQILDFSKKYRAVAIDLRGHGDSDKPDVDYTVDAYANDVGRVIEALNLQDMVLVGWSMGASIATRYMHLSGRNVAKLVLVDGTPLLISTSEFPYGMSADVVDALTAQAQENYPAVARYLVDNMLFKKDVGEATRDWMYSIEMKTPLDVALKSAASLAAADNRNILAEIKVPTLIIHGRHDAYFAPEAGAYFAKKIPGASIVIFEESGHTPFIEEVVKFNDALARFIES